MPRIGGTRPVKSLLERVRFCNAVSPVRVLNLSSPPRARWSRAKATTLPVVSQKTPVQGGQE